MAQCGDMGLSGTVQFCLGQRHIPIRVHQALHSETLKTCARLRLSHSTLCHALPVTHRHPWAMGKRKRVPSTLHSELTEYSSLLRALRTTTTLDLTTHIAQPSAHPSTQLTVSGSVPADELDEAELSPAEDETGYAASRSNAVTEPTTREGSQHTSEGEDEPVEPEAESHSRNRVRGSADASRDTWTRWPLLFGDVHVPEFTLTDEVKFIVEQMKETQTEPGQSSSPTTVEAFSQSLEHPDELDVQHEDLELLLPKVLLDSVGVAAAKRLSEIFGVLNTLAHPVEDSLQNRFGYFTWQGVLNIVNACGIIDDAYVSFGYLIHAGCSLDLPV